MTNAPPIPPPTRIRVTTVLCGFALLGVLVAVPMLFGTLALRAFATADPGDPMTWPDPPEPKMVRIPGGRFEMGDGFPMFADARPIHTVEVDPFWMDATELTNEEFARFVRATGYVTVAERKPDPKDYPGAPPENLVAGSLVFTPPGQDVALSDHLVWWRYVPGANWRHPEGPTSDLRGREKHPVVHVCWEDAAAYAKWAGKRLPTEAEWERAARGGLVGKPFTWGDEFLPGDKWQANIWQGRFPVRNTAEDGYAGTAPVGSYPANGYGLYDMAGNVWEWCSDWYRPDTYAAYDISGVWDGLPDFCRPNAEALPAVKNPHGPPDSFDPVEPGVAKRVQRGGSFLCCDAYCVRYRPGGRGKGAVDSGASHVGFRCVKSE